MKHVQRVPHGLVLSPGSLRVLRWLERYPFQRTQDLIVALAPWEKRTVVYERLAALEQYHLIEAVRPGIAQGKKLYHLSPLGASVCDAQAQGERHERWKQRGSAQVVREEREALVRVLPRLPVWAPVQDLVNGLVTHASAALTSQGRRASVVQWSWQRDYSHSFLGPREKVVRLRVDGALMLCLRYLAASPQESDAVTDREEHWYTFLLLHCPLDDMRLLRMRLDRLLRWRESAERTAVYSQMPALLILATTERQAEWWQVAALQVAARLRVECPLGAVVRLPQHADALANGWSLSWRRLGTREVCHLHDLFRPQRQPALSDLLTGRGSSGKQATLVSVPGHLLTRGYALGGTVGAVSQRRISPVRELCDYRLASLRLTRRHWEILLLFFSHPFLSQENLSLLLTLSQTSINVLLADLTRAGYLVGISTAVGERWRLAEDGLLLLARLASCHVQRLVHVAQEDEASLQQRGTPGLLHQIQHTAGVYGFFAQLCASLATVPDAQVRWWETGVNSEWHFSYREQTYRFRPDALACVQIGERAFRFWLEWDRGTMGKRDLQIKFATYAMYLESREWARSAPSLPALLCVTPEIGQERRMAEATRQRFGQGPTAFRVYTTTAPLLATQGTLAPIWQQVVLAGQQAQPAGQRRIALFERGEGN